MSDIYPTSAQFIGETIHLLPDIDRLTHQLTDEPETIFSQLFPQLKSAPPPLSTLFPLDADLESTGLGPPIRVEKEVTLAAAGRALVKIQAEGETARLEPEEAFGYEAILSLMGRPAILIQNGRFFPPPTGWEVLEDHRESIETLSRSVGRIEVSGHPELDWVGTGFSVADGVVMTNEHVVKQFSDWGGNGRLAFKPGMEPRVDFKEELGTVQKIEFPLTKLIGVHESHDLALLRIDAPSTGEELPEPIVLASEVPDDMVSLKVFLVGYPTWDGKRNDPEPMRRIFQNIWGVKRLQPGEVTDVVVQDSVFDHDCSTLGGNSGSCVFDLETGLGIGLHYYGRYMKANRAVALWTLRTDPLLEQSNVQFE